ncbi:MAG: phosphatidylglycerol lysyltransferase domain-containing protein [Thermanaerothrix sp.]|nr:phosphatidylglycerol lysyltransferase domain-containing protein [Thermanaerothrix sp.]
MIRYEPIGLSMMDRYEELLRLSPATADHRFPVLFGWHETLGYHLAFGERLCWIRQELPRRLYLSPVGCYDGVDWEAEFRQALGGQGEMASVPEETALMWQRAMPDRIRIEEDRDAFEYLHLAEELAHLRGNRYMRKRNHVNRFAKTFKYSYREITEGDVPRILDFQRRWCSARDCGSSFMLEGENRAVVSILENYGRFHSLVGGYVEVAGAVVAYAIGEGAGDVLYVHFEKADPSYASAYQVINREFALHNLDRFKVINREEDMGDPGLREAKMSYLPMGFVRKYRVFWSQGGF